MCLRRSEKMRGIIESILISSFLLSITSSCIGYGPCSQSDIFLDNGICITNLHQTQYTEEQVQIVVDVIEQEFINYFGLDLNDVTSRVPIEIKFSSTILKCSASENGCSGLAWSLGWDQPTSTGYVIEVHARNALGTTALAHEFIHLAFYEIYLDGDATHSRKEWFQKELVDTLQTKVRHSLGEE
jgi:hypothetical protein